LAKYQSSATTLEVVAMSLPVEAPKKLSEGLLELARHAVALHLRNQRPIAK